MATVFVQNFMAVLKFIWYFYTTNKGIASVADFQRRSLFTLNRAANPIRSPKIAHCLAS